MKKQLLLGTALLAAITTFSQQNRPADQHAGAVHVKDLQMNTFAIEENAPTTYNKQKAADLDKMVKAQTPAAELTSAKSMSPTSINWKLVCGSMNCYGQLVSNTRPLQYNPDLNIVSIVHRKSNTYSATPVVPAGSESGVIVAEISGNWGTSWDSTCIYAGSADAGRYPQGAVYNPPTNTNIANAYIVGSGPCVNGTAFTGDFYASKQLAPAGSGQYNTTASTTLNAQQFLSFGLPSYPVGQCRHGWSRYGFTSTSDGVVRSMALIQNDQTTLGTAALMRGMAIVKGTFNAGVFNWTTDTLIPACVMTAGDKVISSDVQMAWNQAGTIGYAVTIGALQTATRSNRGQQPIIYKTTNSGGSWAPVSGIDFNSSNMDVVNDHLRWVTTTAPADTFPLPWIYNYDIAVDSAGYLHIGANVASGAIAHDDSLNYITQYTLSINGPNKKYLWGHRAGLRPYLYDFIGDGTAPWKAIVVDSMWTEDPGSGTTASGYAENPWDPTGTGSAKINMDCRVQLGRTPDGKYISYSWAESDTNFTTGAVKYNILPNIKSRLLRAQGTPTNYAVSTNEINVSKPAVGQGTVNPNVASRATLHYMSPTTSAATVLATAPIIVDVRVPFTVTNSNPWSQLTNNATWYTSALLTYTIGVPVSLQEPVAKDVIAAELYPNPADNNVNVMFNISENKSMNVSVVSILGNVVKNYNINAVSGLNTINVDIADLKGGIYFVNLRSGNTQITKKLIVE
jgi:hypothetical protein